MWLWNLQYVNRTFNKLEYEIQYTLNLCVSITITSPLVWMLVCCLYKEVYLQIFKCVSFWLHGCCGEWKGWTRKPVNHTSWVAVVTRTDRPKSVRNRSVIELFGNFFCVVTLPIWHFCWYKGFCHRTESDLFFFSLAFLVFVNCPPWCFDECQDQCTLH